MGSLVGKRDFSGEWPATTSPPLPRRASVLQTTRSPTAPEGTLPAWLGLSQRMDSTLSASEGGAPQLDFASGVICEWHFLASITQFIPLPFLDRQRTFFLLCISANGPRCLLLVLLRSLLSKGEKLHFLHCYFAD